MTYIRVLDYSMSGWEINGVHIVVPEAYANEKDWLEYVAKVYPCKGVGILKIVNRKPYSKNLVSIAVDKLINHFKTL